MSSRLVRARLDAVARPREPAQQALERLESAVLASQELHRILAELDQMMGSGSAGTAVREMRIHAQQLLNALKFQRGMSIDGSSVGDVLRSELHGAAPDVDAA